MDPEVKKKWVEALRSGDYSQGRFQFASEPQGVKTYCCLGVFCEVANLFGTNDDDGTVINEGDAAFMSKTCERLGLKGHQQTLIDMNDKKRLSFSEIADWIEVNL